MTDTEMKIDVAAANVNVNSGKPGLYRVSVTLNPNLKQNPNPNLTGKHALFRVSYEGKLLENQLSVGG